MRKLWILVLMDFKGIIRKISYYFVISVVIGEIFYSIRDYTSNNIYFFETFQSTCYRWLLLLVACISVFYGAIRTARIRKVGIIEELLAMPVRNTQIIASIYISRILVVWVPVFSAFVFVGVWTHLISLAFFDVFATGISLLIFIGFFTSIGFFWSFFFSSSAVPIIISLMITFIFWHLASSFPYWGNYYLGIQQVIYKTNVGFNPFTFMYAIGFSNFLLSPFFFMILFILMLIAISLSVFKNSGWMPGEVPSKFRIKRIVAIKSMFFVLLVFLILSGILSWFIGFYSFDLSENKLTTPSDALINQAPTMSVTFSPDIVDVHRFSIFFDKLARLSKNRVIWTPTSASNWTGSVLYNSSGNELCVNMGYIRSTVGDLDSLAYKLGRSGVSGDIQKIECRPRLNQLVEFENIAISFSTIGNSRRRVYPIGMEYFNNFEIQFLIEEECFEVVYAPNIDAIIKSVDYSKDLLLIMPETLGELDSKTSEVIFSLINKGTAALIILPELPKIDNIASLFTQKVASPIAHYLGELNLEIFIGRFKYKGLDNYISDNNNLCCQADYAIYAPWGASDSINEKIYAAIEFYSLKSKDSGWRSLLTACDDIQFENIKNKPVSLMMHNSNKNLIVTNLQNIQRLDFGERYEVNRNIIANSLNICAGKELNNTGTYNLIRREKIASDLIFSNKKHNDIDILLIITYIIWMAAVVVTILRVIREWAGKSGR
ncbi:MAG: ABC transporter permease [Planctomycetes bacterium]|nr:ABC transporter permease [Planctomycetota bacterium]